jgi:hypothetical protein
LIRVQLLLLLPAQVLLTVMSWQGVRLPVKAWQEATRRLLLMSVTVIKPSLNQAQHSSPHH